LAAEDQEAIPPLGNIKAPNLQDNRLPHLRDRPLLPDLQEEVL